MAPGNESKLFYLAVGKNIKKYRDLKNYSLQMLAEKVGLTKKTISRYENGEIKIDMNRVADIAEALEVGVDSLLEGAYDYLGLSVDNIPMINLPIVGSVSCGNGVIAVDEIEAYEPTPRSWLNGGEYIYTRARGDSMVGARIFDGDLVLIRRQPDVEDGEIAAVNIDGEIYLKRVYKQKGAIILQSENPSYPPRIVSAGDKSCFVIGKLKKIIINM